MPLQTTASFQARAVYAALNRPPVHLWGLVSGPLRQLGLVLPMLPQTPPLPAAYAKAQSLLLSHPTSGGPPQGSVIQKDPNHTSMIIGVDRSRRHGSMSLASCSVGSSASIKNCMGKA